MVHQKLCWKLVAYPGNAGLSSGSSGTSPAGAAPAPALQGEELAGSWQSGPARASCPAGLSSVRGRAAGLPEGQH